MQCAMQKIYIPGVQLAVPQHIYDKLGLHLNQTVVVSNSQSLRELDTRENDSTSNISDEAPNHYANPLLTQPEINDETVNGQTNESSLENNDGTLLAIVINTENGKQIITTQNFKTSQLSNAQTTCESETNEDESISNSSDDVDTSTENLHNVSYDTPVLTEPEIDKINEGATNQSSFESRNTFQGTSTNTCSAGSGSRKGLYPRNCPKCNRTYISKGSFSNHKKNCDRYAGEKNISYPMSCINCNRSFISSCRFTRHKEKCEKFKRLAECNTMIRTISCEHGHELHRVNPNASNTENEKELYTTKCAACALQYSGPVLFSNPDKKCTVKLRKYVDSAEVTNHVDSADVTNHVDDVEMTQHVDNAKRKLLYPRTCPYCSKIFATKYLFSYHKRNVCNRFKRQTNTPNLMRTSSSSLNFSELNTLENDVNTSNSSSDLHGLAKESPALSDQEKPVKWFPVASDSGKAQTYFVVKKTSS